MALNFGWYKYVVNIPNFYAYDFISRVQAPYSSMAQALQEKVSFESKLSCS